MQVLEYGVPQLIVSDNGSPIVSSLTSIKDFLADEEVKSFLREKY